MLDRALTAAVLDRALTAAALAALAALGALLGVVGGFLTPAFPRLLGVPLPVAVAVAVVGNLAAGAFAVAGTGLRYAAAAPAVGWLLVVVLLGTLRAEGDLVVTGSAGGMAFLILGSVAAAVPLAFAPRRRPPGDAVTSASSGASPGR